MMTMDPESIVRRFPPTDKPRRPISPRSPGRTISLKTGVLNSLTLTHLILAFE